MNLKTKTIRFLVLIFLFTVACNNDNESEEQPEQETFLCCGENPFENQNIDNLDQSAGEVNIRPVFTPNGDAFNDTFGFINMALYQNITVTIFDLDDNTIYSSENYELPDNVWPVNVDSLDSGTYKYKVVIENEQTFVEYGYVCLVKTPEDGAEFSFVNECSLDFFDPILE